jgi:hypothetical protein
MGVALAILVVHAGLAAAGTETRLGTGGAPELRLPVGARSIALAGADLGSVSGVEAIYYNPAGLAATDSRTEVAFSYTKYIADMNLNYFGVATTLGDWGMLGVSVKVLSIGDIVQTTETAPDGNGNTFSPTYSTLGLTYAKRMTDLQTATATSTHRTTTARTTNRRHDDKTGSDRRCSPSSLSRPTRPPENPTGRSSRAATTARAR